jgi:type II secretory pathway component PulC
MDIKTKNSIGWMLLILAFAGTGWAVYDSANRIRELHTEDQVFNFGDGSLQISDQQAVTLDRVINVHLFGVVPVKVEKQVEEPKVQIVDAPKTRLNLTLTGIVSGHSPELGFAMIEVSRGETSVVTVGNEIGKTGVTLHAIEADHVLINHQGKIEKLPLEREALGLGGTPDSEPAPVTVKELALSAAELAALTQVGESVEQESSAFRAGNVEDESNIFSDESFIQSESRSQIEPLQPGDESLATEGEEDEEEEDDEEVQ